MKETDYNKLLASLPASRSFIKKILRNGKLTGSTIFGGENEFSDIDIILKPNILEVYEATDENCIYLPGYRQEGYTSMHVRTFDYLIYNILIMHTKEIYLQWVNATILLQNMLKNNKQLRPLIKNKANRVALFETLKNIITRRQNEQLRTTQKNFTEQTRSPFQIRR